MSLFWGTLLIQVQHYAIIIHCHESEHRRGWMIFVRIIMNRAGALVKGWVRRLVLEQD